MEKISVIIITFNEAHNIGATLDAAGRVADEIIIADSGSTDGTMEICLSKGVTFIYQQWLGFGAQRNFAVNKASHSYILVLDADEVMDDELISNVLRLKDSGFEEKIYAVQRRNFYYGRSILHGMEQADIKPRLYHKDFAKWNNKLVHEALEFSSELKACRLKGYLLHYTYRDISAHIIKTDKYTTLSAQEYFNKGKSEPGFVKLVLSPAFTFINAYFIKAGFLDGWHGWILAKMHANAVLQKYAKLKLLYRENKKLG